MPVTLKDIADELNVSVNTVSRALRDMPDIGPSTTHLVKETANRLGYRKNLAARYLKVNKSMMLGIVVTDICNPVFSSMYKGIESICEQIKYTLMLGNSNENSEEECAIINNMLEHGADGIFLVPSMKDTRILSTLKNANVPYIMLQRKFPGQSTHYIQSSDFQGGYFAAEHLFGLGHRSFLYVSAPLYISSARERYEGFVSYLKERHLGEDCVRILECDNMGSGINQNVKKYLESFQGKPLPITAIFCFSDYMAHGVYSAINDCGLRVPEDISVVGYDNNEYSSMMLPPLTTIDIRPFEVGERAARMMFHLINASGEEPVSPDAVIAPLLVLRHSTAAPRSILPDKAGSP